MTAAASSTVGVVEDDAVPLIEVEGLSKAYTAAETGRYLPVQSILSRLRGRTDGGSGDGGADEDDVDDEEETEWAAPERDRVWALEAVSFSVAPGEILGVVGVAGAGKTTLIRALGGMVPPTAGRALLRGRVAPTADFAAAFMQPDATVERNATTITRLTRVRRSERADVRRAAIDLAFPDKRQLRGLSGKAIVQRLAIAVALDPYADVVLLDDPNFFPGSTFGARCYARLDELRRDRAAIVLASEDASTIRRFCTRAILLDDGRVLERGDVESVLRAYGQIVRSEAARQGPTAPQDEALGGDEFATDTVGRPIAGFNDVAAVLDVAVPETSKGADGEIPVRIVLEVGDSAVTTRSIVRMRREDGWSKRFAQEDPLPELERGTHEVVLLIPVDALEGGDYSVDVRVKLRLGARKSAIGRMDVAVLEVASPLAGALGQIGEESTGMVGEPSDDLDGARDGPIFVASIVERVR